MDGMDSMDGVDGVDGVDPMGGGGPESRAARRGFPPPGVLFMLRHARKRRAYTPAALRAALTVLRMSMAMVMGPTPPGTGVMAPAISDTCP